MPGGKKDNLLGKVNGLISHIQEGMCEKKLTAQEMPGWSLFNDHELELFYNEVCIESLTKAKNTLKYMILMPSGPHFGQSVW